MIKLTTWVNNFSLLKKRQIVDSLRAHCDNNITLKKEDVDKVSKIETIVTKETAYSFSGEDNILRISITSKNLNIFMFPYIVHIELTSDILKLSEKLTSICRLIHKSMKFLDDLFIKDKRMMWIKELKDLFIYI